MQQHTILTNRAAKQPAATCPDCHGTTRTTNRDGYLWRVCSERSCTWEGLFLEAETAAALEGMDEAGRARVMAVRGSSLQRHDAANLGSPLD